MEMLAPWILFAVYFGCGFGLLILTAKYDHIVDTRGLEFISMLFWPILMMHILMIIAVSRWRK